MAYNMPTKGPSMGHVVTFGEIAGPEIPSKHSTPALAQFEQAGEAPSHRTLRRRHREHASGRRRAGGLVGVGGGRPAII